MACTHSRQVFPTSLTDTKFERKKRKKEKKKTTISRLFTVFVSVNFLHKLKQSLDLPAESTVSSDCQEPDWPMKYPVHTADEDEGHNVLKCRDGHVMDKVHRALT